MSSRLGDSMPLKKDGWRLVALVVLGRLVVPFGSIVDVVVRTLGVGLVHRWGRRVTVSCIVVVTYCWRGSLMGLCNTCC